MSVRADASGGVLTLTLDRPERRNSLDADAQLELKRLLADASTDETLRVIHLTGAGDHFCAGADWVKTNSGGEARPRSGAMTRRTPQQAHGIIELLTRIQLPVVASVRGYAAGLGCHLALAADVTVAADDALFWEPFGDRGFTPDSGGTWLLPRLIGVARAKRMLLLGEKVSGATAADWGLIAEAVPAGELDAAAEKVVAKLAAGPTVALGLTRQLVNRSLETGLVEAMTNESFGLELSSRTGDFREGLVAFKERRDPDFTGR